MAVVTTDSDLADRLAAELRLARQSAADGTELDRLQRLRHVLSEGLKGLDPARRSGCLSQLTRRFPAFGAYEIQAAAPPPPVSPVEARPRTVAELVHELANAVSRSSRGEVVRSAQSALEVIEKQDPQKYAELLAALRALDPMGQIMPVGVVSPPPASTASGGFGPTSGLPFNLGNRSLEAHEQKRLVEAINDLSTRVAAIHQAAGELLSTIVDQVVSSGLAAQEDLRDLRPKGDGLSLDKAVQTTVKAGKGDGIVSWLNEFVRRFNLLFLLVRYGPEEFAEFLHSTFDPTTITRNAPSTFNKATGYWRQYEDEYGHYFPNSTKSIQAMVAKKMCDAHKRVPARSSGDA